MKKKTISILVVTLVFSIAALGQKILIKEMETDGKLSWDHFTGKVDKSSTFHAYTYYNLNYKYSGTVMVGDSVTIKGFEVTLTLDHNNSWAKKDKLTNDLLIHEQGHFNLGILCMNEIIRKMKDAKFKKGDASAAIQNIFSEVNAKYKKLGLQYDEETNHSQNKEMQAQWNDFYSKSL